jgi:hypothetical protein
MKIAITIAAGLVLSGCSQTLGLMTPLAPAHVNSLKAACATADQLYPTFKALVDGGVIKASVAKKGEYAYQVTRPLCATPANATYNDILVATAQAAILAKILKDAE